MALEDVILPKQYKNGKILFEQNLDLWRLKAQEEFNIGNLNFTQLAKDCFSVGYTYSNDGVAHKPLSLEDRLGKFSSGVFPIPGTSSPTFTINSLANSATLNTSLLTTNRTYFFPDDSGVFVIDNNGAEWKNSTAFFGKIFHAITAPRIWSLPDVSGTIAILTAGGLFTPGSIIFGSATGGLAQDNANFFWDDTLHRLGIGTATPGVDFDINKSVIGATLTSRIQNTDNTNPASHAMIWASVGGVAGGNPFIFLDIVGSSGWYVGLDNVDLDKFKIGFGSNVGTTPAFIIDLNLDVSIISTKKFFLDGGGDTYITETSANLGYLVAGANEAFSWGITDVGIPSGQKIHLDGLNLAGDTYITEISANIGNLVAGGNAAFAWGASSVGIVSGQRMFLDGVALTGNTSIRESAADTIALETAGVDRLTLTAANADFTPRVNSTDATATPPNATTGAFNSVLCVWAGVQATAGGVIVQGINAASVAGAFGAYTFNFSVGANTTGCGSANPVNTIVSTVMSALVTSLNTNSVQIGVVDDTGVGIGSGYTITRLRS